MEKKKNNPIYLGFASQKGGVGKSSLAEVLVPYYITRRTSPLPSWIATVRRNLSTNSANATETSSSPHPNWAKNSMSGCPATARNHTISSEASRKEPFPMS